MVSLQVTNLQVGFENLGVVNLAATTAVIVGRSRPALKPEQFPFGCCRRRPRSWRSISQAHILAMSRVAEIKPFETMARAKSNRVGAGRNCHRFEGFVGFETRTLTLQHCGDILF